MLKLKISRDVLEAGKMEESALYVVSSYSWRSRGLHGALKFQEVNIGASGMLSSGMLI